MTGLLLQLAIMSLWPVLLGGLLLLIAWGGFLAVDAISPPPPDVTLPGKALDRMSHETAPSAVSEPPPANVYYLADRAKSRRSAS